MTLSCVDVARLFNIPMKGRQKIWCFSLAALVCPNKMTAMATAIYHEKQVKELCALHALNNLFQNSAAYSKQQLDSICYSLSPDHFVNPHKSMLGLGNYDVNVLMAALQMKGCEAVWFDKRKDPSCMNLSNIEGFILNIPSEYRLGFFRLPIRRKHWIAIREIGGLFYNLDSKLDQPELIGKELDLLTFLREQIQSHEREIFIVVTKEVEQCRSWRKDSSDSGACTPSAQNSSSKPSENCGNLDNLVHAEHPTSIPCNNNSHDQIICSS